MKRIITPSTFLLSMLLLIGFASMAQTNTHAKKGNHPQMKTYLIERDIPNAGQLTPAQLKTIAQTSNKVIREMGPDIKWINSYVTGDKIFCVYKAENEDLIKEHAKKGGFPANQITEVANIFSPATGK